MWAFIFFPTSTYKLSVLLCAYREKGVYRDRRGKRQRQTDRADTATATAVERLRQRESKRLSAQKKVDAEWQRQRRKKDR